MQVLRCWRGHPKKPRVACAVCHAKRLWAKGAKITLDKKPKFYMSSKLLKYYASRRGLTLLMLADLAGVSQSTISRKYKIVWKETADKLAHVLEINREDFGTDEL